MPCVLDTAIWPDPTVLDLPDDATPQQVARLEVEIELALTYAWETMQMLTAYQIAYCTVTVRPCADGCAPGSYSIAPVSGPNVAPFYPQVINGQWVNVLCGHESIDCGCSRTHQVTLPGPVAEVTEVQIDGTALPPGAYRIDNGRKLVRQDGGGWPSCQDFNEPDYGDNTFSVTYLPGAAHSILVRYAVGVLADEYLKAVRGDRNCRLPGGVTTLIRQGVTMEIEKDLFENSLTGIREVDAVTARYNPYRLKTPSSFSSIDTDRGRQTTSYGPTGS